MVQKPRKELSTTSVDTGGYTLVRPQANEPELAINSAIFGGNNSIESRMKTFVI